LLLTLNLVLEMILYPDPVISTPIHTPSYHLV